MSDQAVLYLLVAAVFVIGFIAGYQFGETRGYEDGRRIGRLEEIVALMHAREDDDE